MVFWKNPFLTEIWPFLCYQNSCFQGMFRALEDSKRPKNRFLRLKITPDVLQNGPGSFWEKSVLVEKNVFFDPLERTRGPRRPTRHWAVFSWFWVKYGVFGSSTSGKHWQVHNPAVCDLFTGRTAPSVWTLGKNKPFWPVFGLFLACFWPVWSVFGRFGRVNDIKMRFRPQKVTPDQNSDRQEKKKRPKRPIFGFFRPFLSFFGHFCWYYCTMAPAQWPKMKILVWNLFQVKNMVERYHLSLIWGPNSK